MKSKNNILLSLGFSKFIALSFGLSVGGLSTYSSQAATQTWSGTNSGVWDTSALNWDSGAFAWTPSNDALFTGTPTNNVTTATGRTIGAITLDNTFTGSVTMSGSNTVSGATTISGGTLNLNNATGLGTSAITVNSGGIVAINTGAAAATVANDFSGAGILNTTLPTGANSLTLSGALNGVTGTLNVGSGSAGGKLVLSNATQVPSSSATINVATNGTLFVFNPLNYGSSLFLNGGTTGEALGQLRLESSTWSGNITLNANTTIGGNVGTGASTISGVISGSGFGFTRLGNGTTILTNANTYTGTTTISAGTLQLGNGTTDGSIANASNITNNATLNFNNINPLTYTGNITGTGVLTKTSAGTLTLGGTSSVKTLNVNANTAIDIGTGSLTVSNLGANTIQSTTGGTINGTGGGTIVLGSNGGGSNYGDIGTASGTTLTINAIIAGPTAANGFEVYGGATGGTVVLTAQNTFTGDVNIDGGTLSVANIGNTGSVTSNLGAGTTIFIGGTTAVLKYTGTGETTNRIISLFGTTASAAIDQSGASGNLLFTANFATPGAGSKTLFLQGSTAGTGEISGAIIDNSGTNKTALTKGGTGTWTLSGANTYTGVTNVSAGRLLLSAGSITSSFINVGTANPSAAAMYQSGGTITTSGSTEHQINIGNAVGAFGYYNLSSGMITMGTGSGTNGAEFDVGGGSGGAGTFGQFDMSGGTINMPNTPSSYFLVNRGAAGETAVFNLSGGTVQIAGGGTPTNGNFNGLAIGLQNVGSLTSTVTISGTGQFLTPSLTVKLNDTNFGASSNGTNVSYLNLNGGALQTLGFGTAVNTGGGNGSAVLNFNGGLLKAGTAGNTSFLSSLGSVFVNSGGGTIDNNSQNITIGQALLTPTGSGVTSVAVTTAGAGYTVPPKVSFTGGTGTGAMACATIDPTTGAVTGIVITNPGNYSVAPTGYTLTAQTGFSGTAATTGAISTAANTSGGMTFAGSGKTTLTGTNTYNGDTTVTAGVLAVNGTSIENTTKLAINGTGKVDVAGTEVVGTLFFGGVQQANGLWGSTSSSAPPAHQDDSRFSGTGVVSVGAGYSTWATTNVGGQTPSEDYNNDGVGNGIAYFMNNTGIITLPGIVGGAVTWTNGGNIPTSAYGTQYRVQTSPDLVNWTPVTSGGLTTNTAGPGGSLTYTLPTGQGTFFVRLVVTPQ